MAKKPTRKSKRATADRSSVPVGPRPAAVRAATRAESKPRTDLRASPPLIVGIGASAGGLEAFSQLLEAIPDELRAALVFVQHLAPQHESALPALLSAHTSMPVLQVTDGMPVEPRHVYVIPPNVQMGISDGVLRLLPRGLDRAQFTPIDFFLQSLARWAEARAVGVILSGTASDGAAGIREIKAAGGITIAQTPKTAKYDGMPRAAIGTGMVDLVLGPAEIAEQLAVIEAHPYHEERSAAAPDDSGPTDEQLGEIFVLLRRVSGVDFRQYKTPTVKRRLLRRMALHRMTSAADYLRFLREHTKEVHALYQDLLIHVTRFFREPDSFDVLATQVFQSFTGERHDDEPIRIWIPGCATGEEAYSIAITLIESAGEQIAGRRVQIFATDVSETAIEQARAGVYPLSIAADVSPERLKRFFSKADGGYKVNKAVRDLCVFARHDLTRDPPFSRLDLIVCRNVMIYLDAPLQKRLISVFHYALKSTGFLMLGAAETTGSQHLFSIVDKRWRLYRKTAYDASTPISFSVERFPHLPSAPNVPRQAQKLEGRSIHDEANRLLLQRYGPPSVVVDDNLQIVQFRGQTGAFLEAASGEPNLNLLKMAREGLLFPLRSAIQSARRKHRPVRREHVLVRRNGDWQEITVEVVPLNASGTRHFLVTFETTEPARRAKGRPQPTKDVRRTTKRDADERVAGLTRELAASREYLQSIIQELEAANEELQSANEEILSSNEELQSTNEELDTAKEELQSTNEELNTVNEELHARNDELSRVNSDLINLLATVDITILIVGDDLRIRRFTPTAERVLNLIPGDIGRPIGQINTNLISDNLESLTRETIDTMVTRELEVQDRQGRWYSLRIRPYKNVDNRIDGAVLTLMDIGPVKQYQQQVAQSRDQLLRTLELVGDPGLIVDEDLHVKGATKSFERLFGFEAGDVAGLAILDLGQGRWNVPRLRTLLKNSVEGSEHELVEATVTGELFGSDGKPRSVRVGARPLPLGTARWTMLTFRDASDEKGER